MKFIVCFFTIFTPLISYAESIYVSPVQGVNVSKKEANTIRELIKVEIQSDSQHRLVDSLESSQFYIQTKLIKLNQYTLSMTRWSGDQKKNTGQWKAESLNELESLLPGAVNELVNSEHNTRPAQEYKEKTLGERAMEKKQRSSNERVFAPKQVIVAFGPAFFSNMNTSDSGLGFQAGYMWNVDDHFDLGLQTSFAISTEHNDANALNGKIICNYHFNSQDISPFVGMGFGYGWANIHQDNSISDDSAAGFALGAQAGLKFFRTSSVNLTVAGEYTRILDKSSLGQPQAFFLKVGLLY